MLVWCDIETTGLRADKNAVLEIACIATDDALNEIARIQRVVYFEHAADIVEMLAAGRSYSEVVSVIMPRLEFGAAPDEYVLAMHDKNGLWKDCVNGLARDTVDRDLAAFVEKHGITMECALIGPDGTSRFRRVMPQLAGSTISFDRGFIQHHMPRFAKTLHYRNCDVSTLNETARRFWPELHAARPNATMMKEDITHRGMADIEESIRVYKHYLAGLTPVASVITEFERIVKALRP